MHQGQNPAPQTPHNVVLQHRPHEASPNSTTPHPPQPANPQSQPSADDNQIASSLDDLIASASKQADDNAAVAATATPQPQPTASAAAPAAAKGDAPEDKAEKKDKEKPKTTRLVYSDNETSPEEKMAMMPKYAFTPAQKSIMV